MGSVQEKGLIRTVKGDKHKLGQDGNVNEIPRRYKDGNGRTYSQKLKPDEMGTDTMERRDHVTHGSSRTARHTMDPRKPILNMGMGSSLISEEYKYMKHWREQEQ